MGKLTEYQITIETSPGNFETFKVSPEVYAYIKRLESQLDAVKKQKKKQ